MKMAPESFIQGILFNFMHAKAVFCGEDFRFGKNAAGDTSLLKAACEKNGIRFDILPPVLDDGLPVSSTRIRNALREGDIELAKPAARKPLYDLWDGRARTAYGPFLGFPTINQLFSPEDLIPRFGVYATIVEIDGKQYVGATDIGVKPTVGEGYAPAAETYILDFDGDLYGRNITLRYYAFLRGERRFDSLQQLTDTVLANATAGKRIASTADFRLICHFHLTKRKQHDIISGTVSVLYNAGMAELADALDLGSSAARRVGSTPTIRTR